MCVYRPKRTWCRKLQSVSVLINQQRGSGHALANYMYRLGQPGWQWNANRQGSYDCCNSACTQLSRQCNPAPQPQQPALLQFLCAVNSCNSTA